MSEVRYLQEQAARAERLARNSTDRSLAEKLQTLAQEYRQRAEALAAKLDLVLA